MIDSQLNLENSQIDEDKPPSFYLAQGLQCYLPGSLKYYKVTAVRETNEKVLVMK